MLMASVLGASISSTAYAASPAGFSSSPNPSGMTHVMPKKGYHKYTVAQVLQNAVDDRKVVITGRLINFLGNERYEFADRTGHIVVKLDDDKDWSYLRKDQMITIFGKVDIDDGLIEIEVKRAVPVDHH